MTDPIFILKGVCGSVAHGLAHEDSDEDMHGVFSWPTRAFWSLSKPAESIVRTDPDEAYHELEKFLKLATGCNPQVLELLWLGEYTELEYGWGQDLIGLQRAVLSAKRVQDAYMGYADSQFKKLNERGETFSSSTRNRTFKHAKHMFRLMEQGRHLYETGELLVKVGDPDWYLEEMPNMSLDQIKDEFRRQFDDFRGSKTALPDRPDMDAVNNYIHDYRRHH